MAPGIPGLRLFRISLRAEAFDAEVLRNSEPRVATGTWMAAGTRLGVVEHINRGISVCVRHE